MQRAVGVNRLSYIKTYWLPFLKSILIAAGALWLPLEAYEGLSNLQVDLSFSLFVTASVVVGIGIFCLDGFYIAGFLRKHVTITSNSFDTKIIVKFGDLFEQDGWKVIGANDFFDSVVDEKLVSSNTLHGYAINTYWSGDSSGWQELIDQSLAEEKFKTRKRKDGKGNRRRFPIGTTAIAETNGHKFLFVALGKTGKADNVVAVTAESLICATRGMLKKARTVCSNEPLRIPLMGSGLGRIGIKNAIVVDLILAAIVEETKLAKITDSITIVLPNEKSTEINLGSIARDWK
jgi:hypothetical protein